MFPPDFRARLSYLEERLNRISDADEEWWPFSFLRPEPHVELGAGSVFVLSVLHAVPACLIAVVMGRATGDRVSAERLAEITALAAIAFFVLFRVSFGFSWNRRARRLRRAHTSSSPTRRVGMEAD